MRTRYADSHRSNLIRGGVIGPLPADLQEFVQLSSTIINNVSEVVYLLDPSALRFVPSVKRRKTVETKPSSLFQSCHTTVCIFKP